MRVTAPSHLQNICTCLLPQLFHEGYGPLAFANQLTVLASCHCSFMRVTAPCSLWKLYSIARVFPLLLHEGHGPPPTSLLFPMRCTGQGQALTPTLESGKQLQRLVQLLLQLSLRIVSKYLYRLFSALFLIHSKQMKREHVFTAFYLENYRMSLAEICCTIHCTKMCVLSPNRRTFSGPG
jgi:hypothetical protein